MEGLDPAVITGALAADDPAGAQWLGQALQQLGSPVQPQALALSFARAGRKLRGPAPAGALQGENAGAGWTRADLGRLVLLRAAVRELEADRAVELVTDLFRRGSLQEQLSVLRTLSWLPRPEQYAGLAAEATRTNAQDVFEALACDNPFPARYLPDLNFNQLVLKALFLGVSAQRIVGLADRVSAELVRMVTDYASERRAAGRSVPEDVARIEALLKEKSP